MGDMGTTDGLPDMRMYGTTAAPTAVQVLAAAQLIKETDASLKRYGNVQAAFAAGYTYVLKTNGEEHLLYDGGDPSYQGLNPQHPSSLVYAIDVPNHAPILLGAMYIMGSDQQNGPQIGGGHVFGFDPSAERGGHHGAQMTPQVQRSRPRPNND